VIIRNRCRGFVIHDDIQLNNTAESCSVAEAPIVNPCLLLQFTLSSHRESYLLPSALLFAAL